MGFGFRLVSGAALSLAMLAGDVSALSLAPAAASAAGRGGFHGGVGVGNRGGFGVGTRGGFGNGYRGGYGGGYRGGGYGYRGYGYRGYGGYYGGFGVGDALLGAAIIGGTAAIIASNNRPVYDDYPVYEAYSPEYAPPPPAAYGYAPPAAGNYAAKDPVDQCSQAAISEAGSRGDAGRVLSIDQVAPHENGARVTGTLEVTKSNRTTERARFTCTADYGQVTSFRFG